METNGNIFGNIPGKIPDEITELLIKSGEVRIERIISNGQSSPDNFWYDQDENEWVLLLKGHAELLFEEKSKSVSLNSGDYINIPAHVKHKVIKTEKDKPTIWLAIFYS